MGVLVACLTTGKGTWGAVSELMRSAEWTKIFIVTNKFGKEKFSHQKPFEFIEINPDGSLEEIRDSVVQGLKGKILDTEAGLNMESGTGKEHMAVLSALLKLGLGVRIVSSEGGTLREL